MARLPRIVVPGQPLHIMHRGNNRQNIFESDEDMFRIRDDIAVSLKKADCSLHAYVIMTNHLHFLLTPNNEKALASFMQSVANRYVRFFNADRKRTGTIWEGRFKSCLVESDRYAMTLYRYIERNPVRAGLVESVADYRWSSYHANALGKKDLLVTEHPLYSALGKTPSARQHQYQKLFDEPVMKQQDEQIDTATMKGEVLGSKVFHQRIGTLVGRITQLGSHGGDRKSQTWKDQVGCKSSQLKHSFPIV